MKAILAVTCFLSAIVLICAPSRDDCEAPHPTPQCAPGVTLETTYHFNNGTRRCEQDFGCAKGPAFFPTEKDCRNACPYGIYASND
uniref:Putative tick kunitz 29 n=1 Tax=Ixodes ricinus TaxID=34613 RepID=V5HZR8_IXORI